MGLANQGYYRNEHGEPQAVENKNIHWVLLQKIQQEADAKITADPGRDNPNREQDQLILSN